MVFSYKNVFTKVSLLHIPYTYSRAVINGKTGKTAVIPKCSDTLTLSQPTGADYSHHIGFVSTKKSRDYTPA